jgi:hypothetical protein
VSRDRRAPDFEELVGEDLEPAERERLRRVHELLVAAGPPPELPPELRAGREGGAVVPLRRVGRRRTGPALILAAALAAAAFGAGFLVGDRSDAEAAPERTVVMRGGGARASLAIFPRDDAGNWPMEMTVRGLPELPDGRSYELWLTKDGRPDARCGTFVVAGAKTVVPLNAPYRLTDYDGWIITRTGSRTTLLTT